MLTNIIIHSICFYKEKDFIQCHYILENHNVENETLSPGKNGGCKLEIPHLT